MAVRSSMAPDYEPSGRVRPIRTCIGCRQRQAAAELLRVVAAPADEGSAEPNVLIPDPRHRVPGRGAWLHLDLACVELAQRRRAFARALRVAGPLNPASIREYLTNNRRKPTGGTPQE